MYLLSRRLLISHEEAADAVQEDHVSWEKRKDLSRINNRNIPCNGKITLDRLKSKQQAI
jgi:RNA polymerase sigma-70 factor (ECF subfamily)